MSTCVGLGWVDTSLEIVYSHLVCCRHSMRSRLSRVRQLSSLSPSILSASAWASTQRNGRQIRANGILSREALLPKTDDFFIYRKGAFPEKTLKLHILRLSFILRPKKMPKPPKFSENMGGERPFSVTEKSSVLGEGGFCYNLRSILTPGEIDDQ